MTSHFDVLVSILCLLAGALFGYVGAHNEIHNECLRLGGFYVDNKTFECREKQ